MAARERRKQLAKLLRKATPGIRLSEHIAEVGPLVFAHACRLGLEGIVSKRLDAPYRSGRAKRWIKTKHAPPSRKDDSSTDWNKLPTSRLPK